MPELTRKIAVLATAGSLASATIVEAADIFTVRAVQAPNNALVRAIAEGAAPTHLDPGRYPDARHLSARRAIDVLCGGWQQAYWDQLLSMNAGHALSPDETLGELAYQLRWPACVFVQRKPSIVVESGDNAFNVYRRLTGDNGTARTVANFFGVESISQIANLQVDQKLVGRHLSLATDLQVESPTLAARLNQLTNTSLSDPALRRVQEDEAPPRLLVAAGYVAETGSIEEPAECAGAQAPTAQQRERIARAYNHSFRRLVDARINREPVEIMVVDNGFLGAERLSSGFSFRPGFPREFFAGNYDGEIGPSLFGGEVQPWIPAPISPSRVAGHGTHVVSLVLGGPDFVEPLRHLVSDGLGTILKVSVVNIGQGQAQLLPGSSRELRTLIGLARFRIVNFSLEYQDDADESIRRDFDYIFSAEQRDKLYVVAAGNDGIPADTRFPAAFGGLPRENIITVAATRPDGSLASFSNWGPSVDIAAPGCAVESIINERYERGPMSGTSQAAPQVSFAAALLRTLGALSPREIKTRLIVSGQLLASPSAGAVASRPPSAVASRSVLDIERALYLFDDYLELSDGRQFLGELLEVSDLSCRDPDGSPLPQARANLWAFKRDDGGGWVFNGRTASQVNPPCRWNGSANAGLVFRPSHEVKATRLEELAAAAQESLAPSFADVRRVITHQALKPN